MFSDGLMVGNIGLVWSAFHGEWSLILAEFFGDAWYVCTGDGNRAFLSEIVQIGETMAFSGHGLDEMDLVILTLRTRIV